jgi:beta-N-acetylhexosaminidase
VSVAKQIKLAEQLISQPSHLSLEQTLADNAVVQLTTKQNSLPVSMAEINRIHLFVLDWQEFGALKHAIISQWQSIGKVAPEVSATVVSEGDTQSQLQSGEKLAKADLVIATVDTKIASAVSSVVDSGGAEDLLSQVTSMKAKSNKVNYGLLLRYQLQQAQKQKVPSVLVAKGSPYLLHPYTDLTDTVLVTFDDHIYQKTDQQTTKKYAYSSGYTSSMAIIFGKQKALGKLPVSLQ